MPSRRIKNIVTIDFKQFTMSRVEPGRFRFNDGYMLESQFAGLCDFLPDARKEIEHIFERSKPDLHDMQLMGVKRNEVGYREVEVENIKFDGKNRLTDWGYKLSFLTMGDGDDRSPRMRFGDTHYTREEARNL